MQGFVADSYMDLQAARLMTIHAAEKVAHGGVRPPPPEEYLSHQGIRAGGEYPVEWSTEPYRSGGQRACRATSPLAGMYLTARTLRLADGPDEVHRILIAKNVLQHYEKGESWDFAG